MCEELCLMGCRCPILLVWVKLSGRTGSQEIISVLMIYAEIVLFSCIQNFFKNALPHSV